MIYGYIFGKEQLIAKLEAMPSNLRRWITKAITEQVILLQRHVVSDKLSGQVLHVRTGTLRRSISIKVDQSDTAITGIVGTNVKYGGIHEYGGIVPSHNRLVTMVFGKPLKFPVWATVKSYDLPARSFLRSSLEDQMPTIREAIQQAAVSAVREGLK